MEIVVFGAAGRVGSRVLARLSGAGVTVRGVVRRPAQEAAVSATGAKPWLVDLVAEGADLSAVLAGADGAVWAAGAGSANGGSALEQVDRAACIRAQQAAMAAGAKRFVQVSSMYADRPAEGPPFLLLALQAKQGSDEALMESELDWTLVRPGGLDEQPGTGRVTASPRLKSGFVPLDDVAEVVTAAILGPLAVRRAFDLSAGDTPVEEALAALA